MGSDARKHIRRCWGCDCGGEDYASTPKPVGAQKFAVDQMAGAIEELTGYRPPTCPWRAMYDPLIGPVIRAANLGSGGLGMWAFDEDPSAVLLDAMSVYLGARTAVSNHDEAEDRKETIAKIKAEEAKGKNRKW